MDCLKYAVLLLCLVAVRAEYAYHRAHYRAGRVWCKVGDCGQGEEAELCSRGWPETTRCVPCDPGTFMNRITRSTEGQQCSNKRICSLNEGLTLLRENDATKNRQCVCDVTLDYYSVDYDPTDPDYSAENCVYCPWIYSYIDPYRGCVPCPGLIYLDSGGYKRCQQNTSTAAETTTTTVQEARTDDTLAKELGGKAAVVNKGSTNSKDSLFSSKMIVFVCVPAGLILVVGGVFYTIRRQWTKRQKRHRDSQTGAETPPSYVARHPRNGTPEESMPALAKADPRAPIPNDTVRLLHQAASSSSPITSGSYNLVSDGPIPTKQDTTDAGVKSAENGRHNIQCVYYFANGRDVKVKGDYKGMSANGNIEKSVIEQTLATDRKTDDPVRDSTAVNINIQPAMAGTADPHENLTETPENVHSAAPETMYSVAECTAHPVQEVGDSRPPPIKPMSGTACNTIPKRP